MTRLVINTRLYTALFTVLFVVECTLKSFIVCSLEDVLLVCDFQTWWRVQNVVNYKYLFPFILPSLHNVKN